MDKTLGSIEFMVDIVGSAIFLVHKLYGGDLRGNSISERKLQIIFSIFLALTRKRFFALFSSHPLPLNLVETRPSSELQFATTEMTRRREGGE